MKNYKERRIYFANKCLVCGRPFRSFKRSRIKHGLCRKHRKNQISENQIDMFTN